MILPIAHYKSTEQKVKSPTLVGLFLGNFASKKEI